MSVPAAEPRPANALRVVILTDDPVRRARLSAIVTGAGHELAVSPEDADVVLADAASIDLDGPAVVTLGLGDVGQAGILPGDAWPTQIDAALRAAAAGLTVRGAASPQPEFRATPAHDAPLLTPREIEVLAAIGDGLSNKEVARRLGISQHTVKFHLESVFRKLGVKSRAEAVRKGLRRGLIEL
jgi:two-component system, NarL family, nitrate/nitrite response regulator NarL